MDTSNINTLWSSLIVEELTRCGLDCFVLASGSRCSPLINAAADLPDVSRILHSDERGASYFALGFAKGRGYPAVCITTSGTAVANCMPAFVEAFNGDVPLILLTADRPPELRKTGANQAVDQPGFFSKFARWEFDLPCPTGEVAPEVVLTTVDQTLYRSVHTPRGPVHLNCPFREPLVPRKSEADFESYLESISSWLEGKNPYTLNVTPQNRMRDGLAKTVSATLKQVRRGLLIVGSLETEAQAQAVASLGEYLEWPILPDVTSGLRIGCPSDHCIAYYDQILLSDDFAETYQPDAVLHIGGPILSKRLLGYLDRTRPQTYIAVQDHPFRRDPNHQVSMKVESDIIRFCEAVSGEVRGMGDTAWREAWKSQSDAVHAVMDRELSDVASLSEPAVARVISKSIPAEHGLVLASSMPVRDMSMYADAAGANIKVMANRGASGIDGTIAAAAGYAHGLGRPITLVIGDLAFLHDVNSLALLKQIDVAVTVVVINNDGGGIYSFLPIAEYPDVFERYYGTPHGMTFDGIAKSYGVDYTKVGTLDAFTSIYEDAVQGSSSSIIEVASNRSDNAAIHKTLDAAVLGIAND